MANLRFSRYAEADLYNIGLYTFRTWGETQAGRDISKMEECCRLLADNPKLGRPCHEVRPALRRLDRASMLCFTGRNRAAFLISRILPQRMLPENLSTEDAEEASK